MQTDDLAAPVSAKMIWAGRIVSAVPVLMLLMSGVMKLMKPASVVQSFTHLGYPEWEIVVLGVVEISCTIVYLVPRTSILGAILLTGYLGGATATHVRVQEPVFVAPFLAGVMVWLGLYLRYRPLRAMIPLRS